MVPRNRREREKKGDGDTWDGMKSVHVKKRSHQPRNGSAQQYYTCDGTASHVIYGNTTPGTHVRAGRSSNIRVMVPHDT